MFGNAVRPCQCLPAGAPALRRRLFPRTALLRGSAKPTIPLVRGAASAEDDSRAGRRASSPDGGGPVQTHDARRITPRSSRPWSDADVSRLLDAYRTKQRDPLAFAWCDFSQEIGRSVLACCAKIGILLGRRTSWKIAELKALRDAVAEAGIGDGTQMDWAAVSAAVGRCPHGCATMAAKLALRASSSYLPWTNDDNKRLIATVERRLAECGKTCWASTATSFPGRTVNAVKQRYYKLGSSFRQFYPRPWDKADLDNAADMALNGEPFEKFLDGLKTQRSIRSVSEYNVLFTPPPPSLENMFHGRFWAAEDIEKLLHYRSTCPPADWAEIGRVLRRRPLACLKVFKKHFVGGPAVFQDDARPPAQKRFLRKRWTSEEKIRMESFTPHPKWREIYCAFPGRSLSAQRAMHYRLRKALREKQKRTKAELTS